MAKEDVAVRELVSRVVEGDAAAEDRLADTLYHQLRGVARRHLASERAGHTLSATALVHEAYLKLAGQDQRPDERAHFLAIASLAMRRVLVSHARKRRAQKRGSGERPVTLDDALMGGAATDGSSRILDIVPRDLHARTPLVFGSKHEVDRVACYVADPAALTDRSPLFGKRSLFRT